MISNYKLIRRISSLTGWSNTQSDLAHHAVLKAIREAILEGRCFHLSKFAKIDFWRRKGRTIPARVNYHGVKLPAVTQPDKWVLRIKPSVALVNKLKTAQTKWPNGPTKI